MNLELNEEEKERLTKLLEKSVRSKTWVIENKKSDDTRLIGYLEIEQKILNKLIK